jgi:DNA-binding response OmpR family regulator
MKQTILLIDDDELLCEMLAYYLELANYHVVQAANGREGLARLAEQQFDLIVLDLLMPEMDGIRFLRLLGAAPEQMPPRPMSKVLVLSASATADIVAELDFPNVVGVYRKPVKPTVLIDRIEAILSGNNAGSSGTGAGSPGDSVD